MKLECQELKHQPAVFFWEEPMEDGKGKKKVFRSLSTREQFDVADEVGHEILTKYKGQFKVLGYGEQAEAPKKKATAAPKTAMIKEEKIK